MPLIRPSKTTDLPTLAAIMASVFTATNPEKPWDTQHTEGYLKHYLDHWPDLFFVAEQDGTIVGAIATGIKPWRTGNRCSDNVLFVDPRFQNTGIATELIKKLMEVAIEKYDAVSAEIVTFADKGFPLSWFDKLGFTPDNNALFLKGNCRDILKKLEKSPSSSRT